MFAAACVVFLLVAVAGAGSVDIFREHLAMRPLADGMVLAHLEFEVQRASLDPTHFELFPKPIGQVLHRFGVEEMHLSLTQGRWDTPRWGYPATSSQLPNPAPGPPGAHLWAWLSDAAEDDDGDTCSDSVGSCAATARWKGLREALSGLFCASLNQLDALHTSRPDRSFERVRAEYGGAELRYGALSRENVCTENLVPWTRLLPCRDQAGLGQLLQALKLYDSHFHSLSVHATPLLSPDGTGEQIGWSWRQTLTAVLDPVDANMGKLRLATQQPGLGDYAWSVAQLLGSAPEACGVAATSTLIVEGGQGYEVAPNCTARQTQGPALALQPLPAQDLSRTADGRTLAIYDLHTHSGQDIAVEYCDLPRRAPFVLHAGENTAQEHGLMTISRHISGEGQAEGGLHVTVHNNHPSQSRTIRYVDIIPWYLQVYWHTMTITLDGERMDPAADLLGFRAMPAERRGRPALIELRAEVPASSGLELSIEFTKAFLTINEFPPDASRGFDIPSGALTVENGPVPQRLFTPGLLVLLPFPDQSMPFNVIAFTSTVVAFLFGSLFNLLHSDSKQLLERERQSKLARVMQKLFFCKRCKSKSTADAS